MSKLVKAIKVCLITYLALVAGGTLLLVMSYCLPTEPMRANLEESSLQLSQEGDYYMSLDDDWRFMYDNYTSAIMLNLAGHATGSPLRDAMLPPLHVTQLEGHGHVYQLAEWLEQAYDEPADQLASYPIYWHGYLVVLKPLLYFFNINQIRQIALVAILGLAALLGARMARCGKLFSLIVIVPLVCFNITGACQSLPFVGSFFVALVAGVTITYMQSDKSTALSKLCAIFLCSGALTAYVDFLDTPIVSLGIPLLVWLCTQWHKGLADVRKTVLTAVGLGFAWSAGYALFWAAKWVLATLLTEQNIIRSAIGEVTQFSGSDGESISRVDALKRNLELAFPAWSCAVMVLGCVVIAIIAAVRRKRLKPCDCWFALACAIVALIPVVWTAFTAGHSYIHYWFTYRNLSLVPMAMLAAWCAVINAAFSTRALTTRKPSHAKD